MLTIDHAKCTRCRLCVNNCPFGALALPEGQICVSDACTLCGACVNVCPQKAIKIERKQVSIEELSQYQGVFIWVEFDKDSNGSRPKKVTYELLGKGRELADQLGQELVAVVIGGESLPAVDQLAEYGADRIIVCKHDLLAEFSTDGYAYVLCAVISRWKPAIVLYGATPNGRDLAPRVAARLKLGLTADCTGLSIDSEGQLVQTRPAFGGNIMASIITPYSRPQTSTVRPNVFGMPSIDLHRHAVIENFEVTLKKTAIRTRVVQRSLIDGDGAMKIEEAKVIVSGGRGCQKAENLALLQDLARKLGGTLAGTRAIVEQGWIPHTSQVGQSGVTVSPDLYIAVGISGAIQHLVGMSSSKTVIAINKDPDAPIFKNADLGIVGDGVEILPILNKMLKHGK